MLQTRTIEPRTLGLLRQLMSMPIFDPFYLVGGTALALQLGHRFSVDLDFFTALSFDKDNIVDVLPAGLRVPKYKKNKYRSAQFPN